LVFGQVADAKSAFTEGHSARVALYVDMIAEGLGRSAAQRRWLKRAGLMHDIGKLGVSNAVLDKPDKLDEGEWRQMQMHAVYSESLLSRVSGFSELAQIAGAHHERLDGHGYPYGLKGDEIAFESRLIGVADFFDALTSERPHRKALSVDNALSLMAASVGTAIDPLCFEALKTAIRRLGVDGPLPVLKTA
jgi:HD-GYP domain-containing protein (c-di-GMP phosphodiesterase class II)